MSEDQELIFLADDADNHIVNDNDSWMRDSLKKLQLSAEEVGRSSSKSWLGYHANVYYVGFQTPPPGAHFSQEWGFKDSYFFHDTTGDWREFDPEDVKKEIYRRAGNPDIRTIETRARFLNNIFYSIKIEIESVLSSANFSTEDNLIKKLSGEIDELEIPTPNKLTALFRPSGQLMSRDSLAVTQGLWTPPHIEVLIKALELQFTWTKIEKLAQLSRQLGSHVARKIRVNRGDSLVQKRVFIGHGRSILWRELKDFVSERLHLPYDEFNRVPVAGITNTSRLLDMLNSSGIAFLIMTGEDETSEGKFHARLNVVHEAGLFQGRLGFSKALILLEVACEEFSNIHGLGQIRFPKGNIKAVFEDIRAVLEREGILPS